MSFLCKILHSWRYETRATEGNALKSTLFYVRICRRCGQEQIQVNIMWGGPMKYVPLHPFPRRGNYENKWEQEAFAQATVAICIKQYGNYFRNDKN